jgi:two-component system response regulator AtoC
MAGRRILIIDDEEGVRTSLGMILEDEGYRVRTADGAGSALELAGSEIFDVVLCDLRMPERDGLSLLSDLLRLQPSATMLVMSAHADVNEALEAVRRGAYDFLAKPFRAEELLLAIRKAEEREQLRRENKRLRQQVESRGPAFIAASEPMRRVVELIDRAAEFKTTVLVTGESGVGKEVVARAIHAMSPRASSPFLALNCGAMPEGLIDSELFGHVKGAFTGADRESRGVFREADGGTLFLDEIGELPLATQVKLLRVLQEEEVRPVGQAKPDAVDVRIIAATARPLEDEVAGNRFRLDLFYRLNVFRIEIPPLRSRHADIPPLANAILDHLSSKIRKRVEPIGPEVARILCSYEWPGNVRELENVLERGLILAPGSVLTPDLLMLPHGQAVTAITRSRRLETEGESAPGARERIATNGLSVKKNTKILECQLIREALACTKGNRTQAALLLELSARALQYKIKEYAIDVSNPLQGELDRV